MHVTDVFFAICVIILALIFI